MYKINFNSPSSVHFIGIGGISMSGLAEILLEEGFSVSGSDMNQSDLTEHLKSNGAEIFYTQSGDNIPSDIDFVVYTAAVKADNPEYQAALRQNIPLLTRAQLLGQIMDHYDLSVGIAGTHGKTTTTSMLSQILLTADVDPTLSIGGILKQIGGNIRVGHSPYFVTEACEYTNSFLSFYPKIGVILNVCADHLDFFKDLDDIRHSFRLYAENIPPSGVLILNHHIDNPSYFTDGLSCRKITFGLTPDANFSASNIQYDAYACGSYDLMINGIYNMHIQLKVTGEHNILNSLAAIAAAFELKIPADAILQGLLSYEGADRRFQIKGHYHGAIIVDDYAHHPDEIRATLCAAKNYPHKKLWCIFQPHTYSRTKSFLIEFAQALSLADEIILADIYPARETDTLGISSQDLQAEIQKLGKRSYYFPTFQEIEKFLSEISINEDMLITMGAGNIVNVGEFLLSH